MSFKQTNEILLAAYKKEKAAQSSRAATNLSSVPAESKEIEEDVLAEKAFAGDALPDGF